MCVRVFVCVLHVFYQVESFGSFGVCPGTFSPSLEWKVFHSWLAAYVILYANE